MKTVFALALFAAAATSAASAKPADLSEFAGAFKGRTTLVYAGTTFTGISTQRLAVRGKRRLTALRCRASVANGTVTQDAGNTYSFGPGARFSAKRAAPGIADVPVSGSYRLRGKTLTATATHVGDQVVKIAIRLRVTKTSVLVETTQSIDGAASYWIRYSGQRRADGDPNRR